MDCLNGGRIFRLEGLYEVFRGFGGPGKMGAHFRLCSRFGLCRSDAGCEGERPFGSFCWFVRSNQNGCCMYQSHFELHRLLFQGGDRSRQFYRSQSIREVSPRLMRGLRNSLGPCLVTARQGAGRTALLRQIQRELEHDGRALVISAAAVDSPASLMRLMLHCASRPSGSSSNGQPAETAELSHWSVIQLLQKNMDFWGPVFLLLDDAHLLAPALLNELRALSEEEWQGRGLIRILASAPQSFEMQLGRPECQSFAQRLCCHEVLEPLTTAESLELLRIEVEAAGGRPERVFSESAALLLASASEGLPRQLSLLANETLAAAVDMGLRPADESAVHSALKRVQHLALSWNLPTVAYGDDNEWLNSTSSRTSDHSVGHTLELTPGSPDDFRAAGQSTPGVVEIGAPPVSAPPVLTTETFATTTELRITAEPPLTSEPSVAPPAVLPTPFLLPLPSPPPLPMQQPDGNLLWDPEQADFSSIVPLPDRFNEPLNFGLISGDPNWCEPVDWEPLPAAAQHIPEFRVADADVLPEIAAVSEPCPAVVLPPPLPVEATHSPQATDHIESPVHSVQSPPPVVVGTSSGIQPITETGDELFQAFSGRRLNTPATTKVEWVEGDFSEAVSIERPVSFPIWRDGSLLKQSSEFPNLRPATDPLPEADAAADAAARFATLFTRLRRLQSQMDPGHGVDVRDESGTGTDR